MRMRWLLGVLPVCGAALAFAQAPDAVPLAQEPHHHLAMRNEFVNLYRVQIAPGDAALLHRHDNDAVTVIIDDAQVTVHTPGQPDQHQMVKAADVRLQARGTVHSTSIDADSKPYRNVTVELLQPQQGERNLCARVIANDLLHCPTDPALSSEAHQAVPQMETSATSVSLVSIHAHQSLDVGSVSAEVLAILLDDAQLPAPGNAAAGDTLHAGDFVWVEQARPKLTFRNPGDKDARLVLFAFEPSN